MITSQTSCIVLAGGDGTRLGTRDKGLIEAGGKALLGWLLDSVADHCDDIIISANSTNPAYAAYGEVVADDARWHKSGPLAGLASCLPLCSHERVLVCCCDMPLIPAATLERLVLEQQNHAISYVSIDSRPQLLMMIQRELHTSISESLSAGRFGVIDWLRSQSSSELPWRQDPPWLLNINTPQDLAQLQASLSES